jgi:hypothetical protein
MLEAILKYETIINFFCYFPFIVGAILHPKLRESKFSEAVALILFLLFIILTFSILYNGLSKGF